MAPLAFSRILASIVLAPSLAFAQPYGTPDKLSTGLDGADHVVASDLNGDGYPDLVFTNSFVFPPVPRFSAVLGDGAGGFSPPVVGPITDAIGGHAVADIDRDGLPDLVLGRKLGRVDLYLGDGGGAFPVLAFTGTSGFDDIREVLVDDVLGNGVPDIVTMDSTRTVIYHGDGSGGFDAVTTLPQGTDGSGALVDVDRDGRLDVLMVDSASAELVVYLQHVPGDFVRVGSPAPAGSGQLGFFGTGDLNRDGNADAYVTTSGLDLLFLGDGTGSFSGSIVALSQNRTGTVRFLDVDGDGDTDVVVGRFKLLGQAGIEIYTNDGLGKLAAVSSTPSVLNGYFDLMAHDLDLDGRPDLVGLEFVPVDAVSVFLHEAAATAGVTAVGPGTPGCGGLIALEGDSAPARGNLAFGVLCTNAPPGSIGIGMFGSKAMPGLSVQGLNIHLAPPIAQAAFWAVDAGGTGRGALPIPDLGVLQGLSASVQGLWVAPWRRGDSCSASTLRLLTSEVLELTIQ